MNDISVYDLNRRETWQALLDETQSALGLPVALVDPENIILQTSGERNKLCREIRSDKKALPVICGQSQQFMAKMAQTQKAVVVEICEAGLAKFVVPVYRDDNYLGCVTACGCLLPETEVEAFLIEKTAGIDEQAVNEMAVTVPVIQEERFKQIAENLFDRLNPS